MKKDVSFVMLSYNDSEMVLRAVRSIKALKTKYSFDIHVVDNGSKSEVVEELKRKLTDVNLVEGKTNLGTGGYDLANTSSKYIYFTGCDIEVKKDMLDPLVDFLDKNRDYVQAAPLYLNINERSHVDLAGTWLSRSFYSGTFKDYSLGKKPVEIPYIGTGLIRSDFVKKWGYIFDNEYFFYGEDVDLGMRIRLSGGKIMYIPSSVVYHVGSTSRNVHKPAHLTYLMERNLIRTFYTTFSFGSIVKFKLYMVFMRLVAVLKDLITLRVMSAFARLRALFWPLFNISSILKKRKKVQDSRVISDKELLKHFSEKKLFRR